MKRRPQPDQTQPDQTPPDSPVRRVVGDLHRTVLIRIRDQTGRQPGGLDRLAPHGDAHALGTGESLFSQATALTSIPSTA